jgi:hypothetical protein
MEAKGKRRFRFPLISPRGHMLCSAIVGLALLTAGILKALELASVEVDRTLLSPSSRWLHTGLVAFEFLFGLWMIFGLIPEATRRVAIGCFCIFACSALYKTANGEHSCGCFGTMSPPPVYTLMFDLTAIAALFLFRPDAASTSARGSALARTLGFLTLACWGALALAASADRFGQDNAAERITPGRLTGKCLPLLQHIDVGKALAVGRWTIIFYRHDCAVCKRELPRYKKIANDPSARDDWGRIALIEVPPYDRSATETAVAGCPYAVGRLDDSRRWLIKTPMEFSILDCIVMPPRRGETD